MWEIAQTPEPKCQGEEQDHCIYHNVHACTDLLHCTLHQVLCEGPLTLEYKEDKELDGFVRPLLGFWRRTKGHIQNQSCQEAITPGKPICIASRTNLLIQFKTA